MLRNVNFGVNYNQLGLREVRTLFHHLWDITELPGTL
jgi:hypothetical protein